MPQPIRPEDVLPDDRDTVGINGITVRKGTIGAFLLNVAALDQLVEDSPERADLVHHLREGMATLREVGLFDVFAFRSPALAELLGETTTVRTESAGAR